MELTEQDLGSAKPKHLLCARPQLGCCFHAMDSVSSSVNGPDSNTKLIALLLSD